MLIKLNTTLLALIILMGCSANFNDSDYYMASTTNPLPSCPDSPNCILTSFAYDKNIEVIFDIFKLTLTNLGTDSLVTSQNNLKIDAVFKIPVFGWKDDLNIQLATKNNQTIAYARSASRVGSYDFGVNKRRVNKIISQVDKTLKLY